MTGPAAILKFVGIGHSHIVALAKGAYALEAKGVEVERRRLHGRFRYLYDGAYMPAFTGDALNPAILAGIEAQAPQFLLLSIGGNEHNVLSMRQPARRFDFILGAEPDAPVDPAAEIAPEAAIRATLADYMGENMRVLQAIRAASGLPMILVEPPPPLPRAQVLAYPKEFFRSQVDQKSMSPDALRRKVWRVQTAMMQATCAQLGVAYLATPPDMLGPDGLLKRAACGQDASHANDSYGEAMVALAARAILPAVQGAA